MNFWPRCLFDRSAEFSEFWNVSSSLSKCSIYTAHIRDKLSISTLFRQTLSPGLPPPSPVGSVSLALQLTINITDVLRAGLDRNLYSVQSQFGTNPCEEHLSHLYRLIWVSRWSWPHTTPCVGGHSISSSRGDHLFCARRTGIWRPRRQQWRYLSATGLSRTTAAICYQALCYVVETMRGPTLRRHGSRQISKQSKFI